MNRNWNKDWKKSVIVLSGGFDPVHKGHMRMFREASWLGHQVIVGLNSDDSACDVIEKVNSMYDTDHKIYFANGGDRGKDNVPEVDTCKELGVIMLWGVGGGKIQSSSWLIDGKK